MAMKWLTRIFFGVSILLFLGFVVLLIMSKGAKGISQNKLTIQIDKPASQVFPWLTEEARLVQWITGLKSNEPLTEGGLRVGARSKEIVEGQGGEIFVIISEITSLEMNSELGMAFTFDSFEMEALYQLSEKDGTTTVNYSDETQFKSFGLRLFTPLIQNSQKRQLEGDFAKLKSLVEEE
jgi:uncharacterized protein YndB with AHSA1/START domain